MVCLRLPQEGFIRWSARLAASAMVLGLALPEACSGSGGSGSQADITVAVPITPLEVAPSATTVASTSTTDAILASPF